jgi:hypothetical protein
VSEAARRFGARFTFFFFAFLSWFLLVTYCVILPGSGTVAWGQERCSSRPSAPAFPRK